MKFKSASSNRGITSSYPRVTSSNPLIANSNPPVTGSNPHVTASNPQINKSMKFHVNNLKSFSFFKIISPNLFGSS